MRPPPFLVSFPDESSFRQALEAESESAYWPEVEKLAGLRLPPVVSVRVLACLFGFSARFVGAMLHRPERYYRSFVLPQGKKQRQIEAPKVSLKVIQKWLGHHLALAVQLDPCVFGFVPGLSPVAAAARHCNSAWVYSLDLADFFRSTPTERVAEALAGLGYSSYGARLFARLCCYQQHLAQGSPASPVLSNLVLKPLDRILQDLARSTEATYTRYADDMVFSGKGSFPESLREKVLEAIAADGWRIAGGKERLAKVPQRLKVHGLLVNGSRPKLTKGYRHRVRAFRHLVAGRKAKQTDLPRLAGHLAYAASIDRFRLG